MDEDRAPPPQTRSSGRRCDGCGDEMRQERRSDGKYGTLVLRTAIDSSAAGCLTFLYLPRTSPSVPVFFSCTCTCISRLLFSPPSSVLR